MNIILAASNLAFPKVSMLNPDELQSSLPTYLYSMILAAMFEKVI